MASRVNLRFRPVAPADLDTLFEYQRDPEANRMAAFTAPDPNDRAAFDRHWNRILSSPDIDARVIEVGGRLAGSIVLWRDEALDGPEVSYWLGREFWGRGIATDALWRFLSSIETRPLYGRAASTNPASIRVLEKCGFRPWRVDRDVESTHGRVDEHILRLEAEEDRQSRWGPWVAVGERVGHTEEGRRQYRRDTIALLNSKRETDRKAVDHIPVLEANERLYLRLSLIQFLVEVEGYGYRLIAVDWFRDVCIEAELPGYNADDARVICRAWIEGYLYPGQLDGAPPPEP